MSLACPAGRTTDVTLAGWADNQAVQGRNHTVIQWGNWTAGMPYCNIVMPFCSIPMPHSIRNSLLQPWYSVLIDARRIL